jgi:hypothetical protein
MRSRALALDRSRSRTVVSLDSPLTDLDPTYTMGSLWDKILQTNQDRCRSLHVFLCSTSPSSGASSTVSTPLGSRLELSFFQSPQKPHVEMYASPPPLMRSRDHQNLSPALAASPHLFTPPVPFKGTVTPGLSPIDRSPRPPRPIHTLARTPPRRPFLEKLLTIMDDSDEEGLISENREENTSPPPSSIHLGCTSTPLRATPRPSVSPFSSPLSASSSLKAPTSCTATPFRHCESSPTMKRPGSAKTRKRGPPAVRPPYTRENKRLKTTASDSSPSPPTPSNIRTFPSSIPIHPEFPGFYTRFPVIPPVLKAYVSLYFLKFPSPSLRPSGCTLNPPRDALDLYTPRLVRGSGHTKVGLCPICSSTGKGKVWLSMKFSAYKWYAQYHPRVLVLTPHTASCLLS